VDGPLREQQGRLLLIDFRRAWCSQELARRLQLFCSLMSKKGRETMRRGTLRTPAWTLAAFGLAVALSGCGSSDDPNTVGGPPPVGQDPNPNNPNTPAPPTPEEQVKQILDARKADYGEALRTASLKLRDALPSFDEIKQIEAAPNDAAKKVVYEKLVDAMIADPKFATVMVKFFKDTFRTGQVGAIQAGNPNKDTAANFAAQVVVEGRSYKELFTATTNTCPTYDAATNVFTPAACTAGPGGGATVGLITDPGLQAQYFANMAFRRVRFIQETFACSKFPAEYSKTPVAMGSGTYTNPANFDQIGEPAAALTDFQPTATQKYAWRIDKPVTDLTSYGAAIAADPEVGRCAVNRIWNYALSRGDIVNDLATIPVAVTDPLAKDFNANGQKLKETIRAVFKAEDFVKF
jgi:hypothetical protein